MRLIATFGAVLATAAPAKAHDKPEACKTRKCSARVAHRECDQRHPRWCVLHVIYHQRIRGWQRAWLLRIPGCESGWDPYATNPSGSTGLYQFQPSTWSTTPYGQRSIWSARWQSYAAAWMLRAGRSGEWVCQ